MNPKYERSDNYRSEFITHWPPDHSGHYRCVYCGRRIKKDKMQVDHIVAVNLAKHNYISRLFLPREGVNALSNLVPSCPRCNRKKGKSGGFWIIRGRYWKLFMPFYRIRPFFIAGLFLLGCAMILGFFGVEPFDAFLYAISPTLKKLFT